MSQGIQSFFTQPNANRTILFLLLTLIVTYWLSNLIPKALIKIAQAVTSRADNESSDEKVVRFRQMETYLSVTIALIRVVLAFAGGFVAWQIVSPGTNISIAAIGAGTIFVLIAGQTVGSLLRDITAGATMIIEKWFNVGDFVKIEPFGDIVGVVERFTLRSTRIRSLSGEIIWIHNQQITAVHVTPRGVRTMAVDVFARDKSKGEKVINRLISTVPTGPSLLARPLRITDTEKWNDDLWRFTVVGETPPGREWLIEKYFIDALRDVDDGKERADRIFVHEPIARYADPDADRRFGRAVRLKKDS